MSNVQTLSHEVAGNSLVQVIGLCGSVQQAVDSLLVSYFVPMKFLADNQSMADSLDAAIAKAPESTELKAARASLRKADKRAKTTLRQCWKRALVKAGIKAASAKGAPKRGPVAILRDLEALAVGDFTPVSSADGSVISLADFTQKAAGLFKALMEAKAASKPAKAKKAA